MKTFEHCTQDYRDEVRWKADDILEKSIRGWYMSGGRFNPKEISKMFSDAVKTAELIHDLMIATGLYVEKTEKETQDAVRNYQEGDTEGPTGSGGDEGRFRNSILAEIAASDNRTARGGEVNPPEQQPEPNKPGPGTRGGHSCGPSGPPIHTAPDDGPGSIGPSVPDVRGQTDSPSS